MKIHLKEIASPKLDNPIQVLLSDKTMQERMDNVINAMQKCNYDFLVIYCDLEHSGNFEYLTGFVTRFEESLLILSKKNAYFIAGNENINKDSISRCKMTPILYSPFSLCDQPNYSNNELNEIFEEIGMKDKSIGVVGWKGLSNKEYFDVPHWIVKALESVSTKLENATDLFINPEYGVRAINNANEIAYYEYGASLASFGMLRALENIEVEMSETSLATLLNNHGQKPSVVTIAATGKRFENGIIYPTHKKLKKGDALSLTVGYKGGLQSRAGYVVEDESDLNSDNKDYLEKICIPYFNAIVTWLENIKVGVSGSYIYNVIEGVLPKEIYNWKLNPGHLCADEEWLSSPIYKDSKILLESGMIIQFDIIPSISGYAGASCEGGICLADEKLRNQIKEEYPDKYQVFEERRKYINDVIGIKVSEDVLFVGNADAYYRPYLLSKKALVVE